MNSVLLYPISTVLLVFLFSRVGAISVDSPFQVRAAGAESIAVSGYDFGQNTTVALFPDLSIHNVTIRQETCLGNWCLMYIYFDPVPETLIGSVVYMNITSTVDGSYEYTSVFLVVPTAVVIPGNKSISTFEKYATAYGEGLGNCTYVYFYPNGTVQGNVNSVSPNEVEISFNSILDYSFVGSSLSITVYCNGAWSTPALLGFIEYAPVDTSSSIKCSGDSLSLKEQTTVACTIDINGNGHPVFGDGSNFHIYLTHNDTGTISPIVVTSNSTLSFNYTSPLVHSHVTAELNVILVPSPSLSSPSPSSSSSPFSSDVLCDLDQSCSNVNITGSPVVFQIVPPSHARWHIFTLAGVLFAIVIVVSVIIGRKAASSGSRQGYESVA